MKLTYTGKGKIEIDDTNYENFNNIHAEGNSDTTLCGIAPEEGLFEYSFGKITCPNCIYIIENCKKYTKGINY